MAQAIESSMQGNPAFPTSPPDMTTISTAVSAYSTALTAAQSRDKNDVAQKNQLRLQLEDLLAKLANSVKATALNDRTQLVSSGFPLAK